MQRREALRNVAFLVGGGVVLSGTTMSMLFSGCNTAKPNNALFSEDQQNIITELADIIIPTTSCPGAKAAGVGPFITMMVKECYPESVQKDFLKGLEDFEKSTKTALNKTFLEATPKERESMVAKLREQTISSKKADNIASKQPVDANVQDSSIVKSARKNPETSGNFFALMRDLTILGYFSSEIGATQARAYVAVPGRYDGCVDLKPGQKAWA